MMIQLSYGLSYGDAVGNEILEIDRLLRSRGIKTGIYAEHPSRIMQFHPRVRRLGEGFHPTPGDIILYHVTGGADLNLRVFDYGCPVILRYHNITPPEFFEEYSEATRDACALGREQLREMSGKAQAAIADSGFNRDDLVASGFTCPVDVVPILRRPALAWHTRHDPHTILTVGRLAPNKRVDRVIKAFAEYQKRYDPEARFVIAGSDRGLEKYSAELKELCRTIWAKADTSSSDVFQRINKRAGKDSKGSAGEYFRPPVFTGHITNTRLAGMYRKAGLYLTLSEHEGFCVPLVEAMEYGVPIVTAGGTAIPETLGYLTSRETAGASIPSDHTGGSGVILVNSDPETVSEAIHRVLSEPGYRNEILDSQYRRAQELSYRKTGKKMLKSLGNACGILKK